MAKRIDEQCNQRTMHPKHNKWSTNYPMNSSVNVEGSEFENM